MQKEAVLMINLGCFLLLMLVEIIDDKDSFE